MGILQAPANQKKRKKRDTTRRERPSVHRHAFPEFNKENVNLNQQPSVTAVGQTNVGDGEESIVNTGRELNVGDGGELNVGDGEQQNVNIGGEPNIGDVGGETNVGAGEQQNVNIGGEPNIGDVGGETNVGAGEQQNVSDGEENVGGGGNRNAGDEGQQSVGDEENNVNDGGKQIAGDGGEPNADNKEQPPGSNWEEKRSSRKRVRNESEWRLNVWKRARNEGLEYTTRKGEVVQVRKTIHHRCGRCVNKCNEVLSDDDRDKIFHNYLKMGDRQRQRDCIANYVHIKANSRKTPGSRRNMTLHYFFTVRDRRVKVCKAVFLKTLGIREKTVTYTISHRSETGQSAKDGRCNISPGIKKPDEVREAVKSHIASFPALASHYARSGTTRKYLD